MEKQMSNNTFYVQFYVGNKFVVDGQQLVEGITEIKMPFSASVLAFVEKAYNLTEGKIVKDRHLDVYPDLTPVEVHDLVCQNPFIPFNEIKMMLGVR